MTRCALRPEDFHPGQHLVLQGLGRASTDRYVALVAAGSDESVKVRYIHGEFKRFCLGELEMLMPELALGDMGERNFGATIVDIRHSDATVKVQYTSGGFKRFPMMEFKQLVTDQIAIPELSQGERIQDLQVALGKAVKEANYLKGFNKNCNKWAQLTLRFLPHFQRPLGFGVCFAAAPAKHCVEEWLVLVLLGENSAMALQITSLMWLRTIMNYQYRYGMTMREAMRDLYVQGGLPRFYRGIGPALVQGPLMRFVDSSANAGVLAFFQSAHAENWPVWIQTIFASASAASLRIALMPLDAVKTVLQVDGHHGLAQLFARCRAGGSSVLFRGAMASSAATFVSHYPWFTVFNCLNRQLPQYEKRSQQLLRNAGIGFCASVCSDTVSNSLRVLKTHRQTHDQGSYLGIAQAVIRTDGVTGLLSRGLTTRRLGQERPRMRNPSGFVVGVLHLQVYLHVICE
ncbi:Mitochondrial carrier-like protein L276 (VMC1) (Viral mitochondrial carrier) [Durusdinium trenchii]|uniref:Mitochondrial carrier-like protein L276 (VMC1) (Viral mitochondrial carrier) n=1 Tax=Durusdinium trenchii TaxID=1381693 RepID=A0ABP0HPY8_9DINO